MTSPRTPGLLRLPYELVAYIVRSLGIDDVFSFSLCCKHFQYIIREDRFCKPVVMTKVPGTLEAQEALQTGRFSRALRRVAKRRTAVSQASPYVAGIVACADSYGFFGGKLCYVVEARPPRWLRILDIHKSTQWELVVDIPMLIRAAVPRAMESRKCKFRVLYQADGVVSCLFSFAMPRTENWLLIIKPETHRILEVFRLESTARIFVRNNDKFLYFGTHSFEDADGLRKWVIKGFDLTTLSWLPHPRVCLTQMPGCDIGSTVCFEIFGDYFYGLSNQRLFEADDPDWTSHYYCFRFPLDDPSSNKLQTMSKDKSWRRKHTEGPIDDRWGFLSLEIDETSESLVILECRKEWLTGIRGSRRTYYTTDVVFGEETIIEDQERVRLASRGGACDHPQRDDSIPYRRPEYVHAGDDSSVASLLVRSKAHLCAYIRSCQTFIDLIDDPCTETLGSQRLRLRTGHRRLETGTQLVRDGLTPSTVDELVQQPATQPDQENTIFIWPPKNNTPEADLSLDRVHKLLNVEGRIIATSDERSVIYASSDATTGGVKDLVFISFDPAARFAGMEYCGKILGQRSFEDGYDAVSSIKEATPSRTASQLGPEVPLGAAAYATDHSEVSKENPRRSDAAPAQSIAYPPSVPQPPVGTDAWVAYQGAMHLGIQRELLCFR
ncbi:hypothetical protein F5Y14DRAFT_419340 [Nemania sp. NC0429]|nr:hypothetical protein F5Y14DRAFT_419340 [Nemania sp. NC0429]